MSLSLESADGAMMDNDGYVPTFDDSEAPFCRVRLPVYASPAAVEAMFATYVDWSTRHRRVAYFIDMRDFNPLTAPAELRSLFAAHFAKHRELVESATIAEARVVSSLLTRGVLNAVDWLTRSKWPIRAFTDMDAAEKWLRKQIARSSIL